MYTKPNGALEGIFFFSSFWWWQCQKHIKGWKEKGLMYAFIIDKWLQKGLKLKELRKKKSFKKKAWPSMQEEVFLLLSLIDAKVVSRVLRMARITKDQLLWCEDKMRKLDLTDGKLHRDSSPILFPCWWFFAIMFKLSFIGLFVYSLFPIPAFEAQCGGDFVECCK